MCKLESYLLFLSLQNLVPFLGPLLRKSSEVYRNFSVIKSLRESENLQVCVTAKKLSSISFSDNITSWEEFVKKSSFVHAIDLYSIVNCNIG